MEQSPVDNRISDISGMVAAIIEDLSGERPAATDARTTFLEMGYDSLFLTRWPEDPITNEGEDHLPPVAR